MLLYLLIFFIPVIAYFYKKKSIRGNKGLEQSVWFLAVFILFLCVFVGISDMLGGYDRYIYGELFDETADNIRNGGGLMSSYIFIEYPKELGFDFLNVLISFVTANRYIFILILTVIIYTLTFISFKRYMTNYPFAMILFMALIFFFTFTYLRQMLAVCISWLAIKYVIDRKLWKFILIVIISFLFHNSAIILLPIYFLPVRKFRINNILIVMSLCFAIGVTGLPNSLFDAFGGLANAEDRTASYATDTSGFRLPYMIEAVFFLYFLISNYKSIPNEKYRIVLYNMSLFFCGILLFFIKSENGGRLSWYYIIGMISTLTYILTEKKSDDIKSVFLIIICLFLYLRILTSWDSQLYPYKTFFTNGYRKNDYIYQALEYDQNYEKDKFYR